MKCTCPTQRPNARDPTQPIFHWKWGWRWLPNANEIYTKKWNVHGRRKKFASPNARDTNMLVFFALGNAEVLSFALADAKVPNASSFAFWWNIGFSLFILSASQWILKGVLYWGKSVAEVSAIKPKLLLVYMQWVWLLRVTIGKNWNWFNLLFNVKRHICQLYIVGNLCLCHYVGEVIFQTCSQLWANTVIFCEGQLEWLPCKKKGQVIQSSSNSHIQ